MTVLAIRNLSLRIAGRTLLENADLQVDPGRKIGLVGRNGAGKSTLLKSVIAHINGTPDDAVAYEGGEIRLAARARMGHVAQEAPGGPTALIDAVLAADTERTALLAELEANPSPDRLGEIHDRLIAIDADAAPARAAVVLAGLGFNAEAQQRPLSEFSGGWRMRVALAQALFLEPELLLLDEPTNHLDLEATIWLEAWLARFPGAAIVVSHDRNMLDRSVDAIVHLDRGKLTLYPGSFANFVRIRTERQAQVVAQNEKVLADRAHMQAFVDRFRAKASKARQAQSRLKALEKMPAVEAIVEDTVTRFSFPTPGPLPPPILSIDRGRVGYGNHVVLRDLSLRLDQEDRIALLGANGNGKSTLAKLLAGRLEPLSGHIHRAPKLKVGFFAQHQAEELDPKGTPLTHMQEALPRATATQCRAQLARFGLDADRADNLISACSGGEKARLLLALCTRDAPQLLILDEPTNHLDIDAREALVKALADFGGAVVLITHDPHLVELAADRLWLVADGKVQQFDGDLDDYRALLGQGARPAPKAEANSGRREERRDRAEARVAQAPLREKLKRTEERMAKLQAEAKTLDTALANPKLYASNNTALVNRATARRAAVTRELEWLETEWLQITEQLEAAA